MSEINEAIASIFSNLGYSSTVKDITDKDNSIYRAWDSAGRSAVFFRNFGIRWHHRRFLQNVFDAGEEAILELASKNGTGSGISELADRGYLGLDEDKYRYKHHPPGRGS